MPEAPEGFLLYSSIGQAVREGRFHIWSVSTIDEEIETLTGVSTGMRQKDGAVEEGTVNDRMDRRLRELAQTLVRFGKDEEN